MAQHSSPWFGSGSCFSGPHLVSLVLVLAAAYHPGLWSPSEGAGLCRWRLLAQARWNVIFSMLPGRPRPHQLAGTPHPCGWRQGQLSFTFLCLLLILTSVLSIPLKISVSIYVEIYRKLCGPGLQPRQKLSFRLLFWSQLNLPQPWLFPQHCSMWAGEEAPGRKAGKSSSSVDRVSPFTASFPFTHATPLGIVCQYPHRTAEASQVSGRLTVRAAVCPGMRWWGRENRLMGIQGQPKPFLSQALHSTPPEPLHWESHIPRARCPAILGQRLDTISAISKTRAAPHKERSYLLLWEAEDEGY